MKTRNEVAEFINKQLDCDEISDEAWEAKNHCVHYGRYELIELMDFIFEGKPALDTVLIVKKDV